MDTPGLPRWLLPAILIASVLVPAILVVFRRDPGSVWAVVVACVAAALLIRLPDVELFKVGPLEARLRQATARAEATIEQLQNVAVSLSRPALGAVMGQGRFAGGGLRRQQFDTREQVIVELRKLGLSQEQIRSATSLFDNYIRIDMAYDLRQLLHNMDHGQADLMGKIQLCFHRPDRLAFTASSANELRSCLEALIPIQGEVAERFLDLEQFERDGTLRRPEVFLGAE